MEAGGGPQHPGVELRTIRGLGSPRSILALLFPAMGGELPRPCPVAQTWGCSASPLAALLAHGPTFWLGFEAPLTFAISSQHTHTRPPSPKCHQGPPGPGGCRATIAPFLVLRYWENLSHSWGKGNENQPGCSRRQLPGTAANGGNNPAPGCGTSPKPPRFSRRAGLWAPLAATVRAPASPSFPHLCSVKDSRFFTSGR